MAALVASLVLTAVALAKTVSIGNSGGSVGPDSPCDAHCTFINYHNGKPTDVVPHAGKIISFTLRFGSTGGLVQLRILRPQPHGRFKVVRSSGVFQVPPTALPPTVTFSTSIPVKQGDVLALSNNNGALFFAYAKTKTAVHYFLGPLKDGRTGKPNNAQDKIRLMLSAKLKY